MIRNSTESIMNVKHYWKLLRRIAANFSKHDVLTFAAALAFYSALSLSPLLLILVFIAGAIGEETQGQLIEQIVGIVGPQAGEAIQVVIRSAETRPDLANFAGVVSLVTLLVSAAAVFAQLRYSLNHIWEVKERPHVGIMGWIRKRLFAMGMVISFGVLILTSVIGGAIVQGMIGALRGAVPGGALPWQLLDLAITVGVFSLFFAILFRFTPDTPLRWRDVWFGAMVTGILFTIGKFFIGVYLGQSTIGSPYGAAGSVVVLLAWVYYSSLILFAGAEVTRAWSQRHEDSAIQLS